MEKNISVVLKDTDTMLTFLARCREQYILHRGGPNFRMLHEEIKQNFRNQLQDLNEKQPVKYYSAETLRPIYASHIGNSLLKLVAYIMGSKNVITLPMEQQEIAASVIKTLYDAVYVSLEAEYRRIDDFIMLSSKGTPLASAVMKVGEMTAIHEMRSYVRDFVFRKGMTEEERTNVQLADCIGTVCKSVLPVRKFEIIIGEDKRRYGAYHGSAFQSFYCTYAINVLVNNLLTTVREEKAKVQKKD